MRYTIVAVGLLLATVAGAGALAPPDPPDRGSRSVHRTSDLFWNQLGIRRGSALYSYPSLRTLVDGADTIVRARVMDIRPGLSYSEWHDGVEHQIHLFADLDLEVTRVLKWDQRLLTQNIITFQVTAASEEDVIALAQHIPSEEALYFLTNRGLAAERNGESTLVQAARARYFQQLNDMGVFRNINGSVHLPPGGEEPWLDDVDGIPFEDFASDVATLVSEDETR